MSGPQCWFLSVQRDPLRVDRERDSLGVLQRLCCGNRHNGCCRCNELNGSKATRVQGPRTRSRRDCDKVTRDHTSSTNPHNSMVRTPSRQFCSSGKKMYLPILHHCIVWVRFGLKPKCWDRNQSQNRSANLAFDLFSWCVITRCLLQNQGPALRWPALSFQGLHQHGYRFLGFRNLLEHVPMPLARTQTGQVFSCLASSHSKYNADKARFRV